MIPITLREYAAGLQEFSKTNSYLANNILTWEKILADELSAAGDDPTADSVILVVNTSQVQEHLRQQNRNLTGILKVIQSMHRQQKSRADLFKDVPITHTTPVLTEQDLSRYTTAIDSLQRAVVALAELNKEGNPFSNLNKRLVIIMSILPAKHQTHECREKMEQLDTIATTKHSRPSLRKKIMSWLTLGLVGTTIAHA
jgi:hypothetical protein